MHTSTKIQYSLKELDNIKQNEYQSNKLIETYNTQLFEAKVENDRLQEKLKFYELKNAKPQNKVLKNEIPNENILDLEIDQEDEILRNL